MTPIGRGKVLVVDDDTNMRESIDDNLTVEGYTVVQAGSGTEALAAVRAGGAFDAVLMDYNLTDGTGIDAIKKIRTVNGEVPILMLTAHASLDAAVKAIQESVYDFLIKPVDFGALKRSIAKAVEKSRLERDNKRLMADLKNANEKLENLNQMKSKFLSMSSHDMSNSLMTMQVSFEMLSASFKPTEEQRRKMTYISNGISQISRLIEDLVDWASIESGKFRLEKESFDPGVMVEELLVGPQARAEARGLKLTAEVEKGLPPVVADKRRIAQVLNNLLENAIRHSVKDGAIQVLVRRQGAEVVWAVRDSGDGIAAEELDKIFKSFYQKPGQGGAGRLGLGLSIAREVLEAHKGRIWVESPGVGKGATFFFTLPLP